MSDAIDRIGRDVAAHAATAQAERARLDRLIARHTRRRDSMVGPGPREYLTEVMALACSSIPGARVELSGPFGLGCEYGVTIRADQGHAHFTFRSRDHVAVLVDLDSDSGTFRTDSIGRMNGLHRRAAPLDPDPAVLTAMILAQMAENRLRSIADAGGRP